MLQGKSSSFIGMAPVKSCDERNHKDEQFEESTNFDHSSVKEGVGLTTATGTNRTDANRIWCSKVIVILVLMGTAAITATMTYRTIRTNEMGDFKAEFKATARQVVQMSNKNVNNIFLSVRTLSSMFPSAAHHMNTSLPYVTVADFEAIGTNVRQVAEASVLAYAPILRTEQDLQRWSLYSSHNTQWIEDGREVTAQLALAASHVASPGGHTHDGSSGHSHDRFLRTTTSSETEHDSNEPHPGITTFVYSLDNVTGTIVRESGYDVYAPLWQMSPVPNDTNVVNFNLASTPIFGRLLRLVLKGRHGVLSELLDAQELHWWTAGSDNGDDGSPASIVAQPVFDVSVPSADDIVMGTVLALIPWKDFFDDVLPKGHSPVVVVADSCGTNNTFRIEGPEAEFVGKGDHHDGKYNSMEVFFEFDIDVGHTHDSANCHQHIHIFPTDEFKRSFFTQEPVMYAAVILAMFSFAAFVFLLYDWLVTNRQSKTESKANQTNAIVQNLFPGNVAAQLIGPANMEADTLLSGPGSPSPHQTTIAELYPSATVLFADIEGFTAWSSMHDPHQVFTLLETIFQAFDSIAKKLGVYKVETVGDCYVAVCGIPKRYEEHAVQMSRFAQLANSKFSEIVQRLELTLGPGTGDLGMRFGMHSGPVTAGVLRGDRARFQLFGDTVNTASRIESTGRRGCIHLSEQTAADLIRFGKKEWVFRRDDEIEAKGKGKLATYWLQSTVRRPPNPTIETCNESTDLGSEESEAKATVNNWADSEFEVGVPLMRSGIATNLSKMKQNRLVEWNCELLVQLLKKVAVRNNVLSMNVDTNTLTEDFASTSALISAGSLVVDEVTETIEMPPFVQMPDASACELSVEVVSQLRSYVATVAYMYNDNPFHNFEHASHVTMSVNKLLTRIVAPQRELTDTKPAATQALLHRHTYGISSDPLMQFTVVLSALIHDLDHPGIPNGRIIQENPSLAERYQGRSVAEQNSVDLAWMLLMSEKYKDLRFAIACDASELRRFRQIMVNAVVATDIFDQKLSALRRERWQVAFFESQGIPEEENQQDNTNRKAAIVMEHLIQASDVAHTMQHWHVYQKWNQRLFNEMYGVYCEGRADKDPSKGWYQGELGFFDNYVIPLANKLKDCGVFGVSSDEYLTYALANRNEWEEKGSMIVEQYLVEYHHTIS